MTDGLVTLVSLCAVMGAASFLAGILPLSLSLSPPQLRLISTIGMGVLVGTSLIVIIPEGVETLYSAQSKSLDGVRRHISERNNLGSGLPLVETFKNTRRDSANTNALSVPGPVIADGSNIPPATPTMPGVVGIMGEESEAIEKDMTGDSNKTGHHDESHHAWMGIALITGFILMFLVDKLPAYMTASKPNAQPYHISLTNLGRRFDQANSTEEESESFLEVRTDMQSRSRSFATTTGLVIHAAADGIALGASSSASNTGLSLIIFFAIMVHKAPAAFGLTSVLLKQGLSKRSARSHLLLFSLAAPTGALLTWVAAHTLRVGKVSNTENTGWWTGMLLLFSGGTFLYVAMHTMQENGPINEHHLNGHANGSIDGRESLKIEHESSLKDFLAAVFGMILPLFLQIGHAH